MDQLFAGPIHSTPYPQTEPAPLPAGVTRCRYCGPSTDLSNCYAVQVVMTPLDEHRPLSLIIWRDRPHRLRPVSKPRITALRPGDWVRWDGQVYELLELEVWR